MPTTSPLGKVTCRGRLCEATSGHASAGNGNGRACPLEYDDRSALAQLPSSSALLSPLCQSLHFLRKMNAFSKQFAGASLGQPACATGANSIPVAANRWKRRATSAATSAASEETVVSAATPAAAAPASSDDGSQYSWTWVDPQEKSAASAMSDSQSGWDWEADLAPPQSRQVRPGLVMSLVR